MVLDNVISAQKYPKIITQEKKNFMHGSHHFSEKLPFATYKAIAFIIYQF